MAYESARLLVAAIRNAGLNRARIRDAVRDLSPWRGDGAEIDWDNLGRNRSVARGDGVCTLPDRCPASQRAWLVSPRRSPEGRHEVTRVAAVFSARRLWFRPHGDGCAYWHPSRTEP